MACLTNFGDWKVKLGELEAELAEMNTNTEKLQRSYNELLEYKLVLQKVRHVDAKYLRCGTIRHILSAWLALCSLIMTMFKYKLLLLLQAGEFFHSAQNSATDQQKEVEEHAHGERSIDSPLLLEQVLFYWPGCIFLVEL